MAEHTLKLEAGVSVNFSRVAATIESSDSENQIGAICGYVSCIMIHPQDIIGNKLHKVAT